MRARWQILVLAKKRTPALRPPTRRNRRRGPSRAALRCLRTMLAVLATTSLATAGPADEILLALHQPDWRGSSVAFRPDPEAVRQLGRAGDVRIRQFPLPDGRWVDLDLVSTDLVHGSTRFLVDGPDGLQERVRPAMRAFRGRVAGEPDSLVSLNLVGGQVAGFVRVAGSGYTFGPPSFRGAPGSDGRITVRDDAAEAEPPGTCDGESLPEPGGPSIHDPSGGTESFGLPESGIDGSTVLVARIAVEGTVEWVNHHGGVANAEAYTLNLMAQVAAIYENDLNVQIQVPWMLMHTAEPDGYSGESNSTSTILAEMVDRWNSDPDLMQVFRTAVHLFGTYPSGGSGRAYLNVLCDGVPPNANSRDLGVSLLSGTGGSWERKLVAHELGHNFSSPHSHCYQPELDRCYAGESGCYSGTEVATTGTIMSYCSTKTASFHQRALDERLRPAAEAAYPACMDVAGLPGSLGTGPGSAMTVEYAPVCTTEALQTDPGAANASLGYTGSTLAAWIKRFAPTCYPFKLERVQVQMVNTSTVAPGRPLRVLVYTDPSGSGTPAGAALAHSQDTTVQTVGGGTWNRYDLAVPVIITAGDYYIGFQDLEADAGTTYIMDYSTASSGDSWVQGNDTSPAGYGPFPNGTWMIRGEGGGVNEGAMALSWGEPCNAASVPGQDFGVYYGSLGDWSNLSILTCSTRYGTSWLIESLPMDSFWLVVPQSSGNEGSYGRSSFGERLPAAAACKPQAIGGCP